MNGTTGRVLTAMGLGVPLGQIVVWYLETFQLEQPIPSEVAMAFGTVLGGALHFAVRGFQLLLSRRKSDASSNDDDDGGPIGIG